MALLMSAVASHRQCGPMSTPGAGVICGLSLLLILGSAPEKNDVSKFQLNWESEGIRFFSRKTVMCYCYVIVIVIFMSLTFSFVVLVVVLGSLMSSKFNQNLKFFR